MSKSQQIRDALAGCAAGEDMSIIEIREAAGDNKIVSGNLSAMVKNGAVIASGEGHSHRYRLNPDYTPKRGGGIERTLPVKRKKKKNANKPRGGAMPARKVKNLKQIARRLAAAPNKPQASQLSIENLKAAASHLASTVRDQVENLEDNPALLAAVEQHERAAALVEALA